MIAFEISINGKKICTAGIGQLGNLVASLGWCEGPHVASIGMKNADRPLIFRVAGTHVEKASQLEAGFKHTEKLEWGMPKIEVGDEVTIRVIEVTAVDAPQKRKPLP
jgi:hypothetical protein